MIKPVLEEDDSSASITDMVEGRTKKKEAQLRGWNNRADLTREESSLHDQNHLYLITEKFGT